MRNITYDNITQTVQDAYVGAADDRTRELITGLISHLHAFVRETRLSPKEWEQAMEFLLRAGKTSSDERNEFILLSDLLGVSALVDLEDNRNDQGASVSTLLGPFYAPGQPEAEFGADLIKNNGGDRVVVRGQVRSADGMPLAGATVEVWQNGANGLYTVQDPEQAEDNLRATLRTNERGEYCFSTVKPTSYTVPEDSAGGELIRAGGRHCWRPAHIHVMISAQGHKRYVSQIFDENDPYIDEDAVFGVRGPLTVSFDGEPTLEEQARYNKVEMPFNIVDMDFVLAHEG